MKQLQNPETVFEKIIGIVVRLAEHGLIHCDFNEFNIMVRYLHLCVYFKQPPYMSYLLLL